MQLLPMGNKNNNNILKKIKKFTELFLTLANFT